MFDNAALIAETLKTRLTRKSLLAIFVVVFAVEAAFLINMVRTERDSALRELADAARSSLSAMFLTHPYPMTDKLLLATTELLLPGTPITGGIYIRDDGSAVGNFGAAPPIHGGIPTASSKLSSDGRYLDTVWRTLDTGAPYPVAVRLDISGVNIVSDAFAARAFMIALLLTAVIGGVVAIAMASLVLMPLARLRRSLGLAPGIPDSVEAEWRELLEAALRRGRAPRLENPDVERRVEERTAELRAEIEKRAETEAKLARLAQMANDATGPILRIDADGKVLYANEAARELLSAWGTVPGGVLPARWRDRFTSFLQRAKPGEIEEDIDGRWVHMTIVPYTDDGVLNVYGFDITDARRNDPGEPGPASSVSPSMTQMHLGLAVVGGRPALEERLAQGLANAKKERTSGVLYFVEVEEFSDIAQSVGHDAAVRFLGEIAARLRRAMGSLPPILRLERCRFGIVLDGDSVIDAEMAAKQADSLITSLAEPFVIDEQTIQTKSNIGITIFPSDGENAQQLLRNAGMALGHIPINRIPKSVDL